MDSLGGENYCEAMAVNFQKIKDKVDKQRLDQAAKISRTFEYRDPTANIVVGKDMPIEQVDIYIDGEKVPILQPERWIKTIQLAVKRFKSRYGDEAALTIVCRYLKAQDAIKVYVSQGISRRSFGDRREKFLKLLLLYAVQNGLLSID